MVGEVVNIFKSITMGERGGVGLMCENIIGGRDAEGGQSMGNRIKVVMGGRSVGGKGGLGCRSVSGKGGWGKG